MKKEKLGIQFLEHAQRLIALFCKRSIGEIEVCKEGFITLLNSISVYVIILFTWVYCDISVIIDWKRLIH
jgi:hypothetical protein